MIALVLVVGAALAFSQPAVAGVLSAGAIVSALHSRQAIRRDPALGGSTAAVLALVLGGIIFVQVVAPRLIGLIAMSIA